MKKAGANGNNPTLSQEVKTFQKWKKKATPRKAMIVYVLQGYIIKTNYIGGTHRFLITSE